MAKLPEHPHCPYCGSYNTERHWGDNLMQVGASIIGGFASGYFLGNLLSGDTIANGAESLVDGFSQKYTCNECNRDFTLDESEIEDTVTTEAFDYNHSREEIVGRAAFEMEIEDGLDDEFASNIEAFDYDTDRYDIIERDSFEMEIEDVSKIEFEGCSILITGRIFTGCVYTGETVSISGSTGPVYHAEVIGIEKFRKPLDRAAEGDYCGLIINGVNKRYLKPGMRACHMLHINTQPKIRKDNHEKSWSDPMEINESDHPKAKFMKGLYNLAVAQGCKIPMLSDEEVINLAVRYDIDIREGFRIAHKYDAIERLGARGSAQPLQTPDNTKNEETYLEEYRQCLTDGEISSAEIRLLKKLAVSLGISESRTKELEASCKSTQLTDAEKEYLKEYRACLEEAPELSSTARRLLKRIAASLNLSDDQVARLEQMSNR